MPDSKIFIDTDEEITFIIEKIKQTSTKHVALIVPDRASIFITSVSLKLLQKSIDRLDKKVVLVTMDEAGIKMANQIGLTTVQRVREITPEIWNNINKYKPIKKPFAQKNNVTRDDYHPDPIIPLDSQSQDIEESKLQPHENVLNIGEDKFKFHNEQSSENTFVEDGTVLDSSSINDQELENTSYQDENKNIINFADHKNPTESLSEQILKNDNLIAKEEILNEDNYDLIEDSANDSDTEFLHSDLGDSIDKNQQDIADKNNTLYGEEDKILEIDQEFKMPEFHPDVEVEKGSEEISVPQQDIQNISSKSNFVFMIGEDIVDHPKIFRVKKKLGNFKLKSDELKSASIAEMNKEEILGTEEISDNIGQKTIKSYLSQIVDFNKKNVLPASLIAFNFVKAHAQKGKNYLINTIQKGVKNRSKSSKSSISNSSTHSRISNSRKNSSKPLNKKRLYSILGIIVSLLILTGIYAYMIAPDIKIYAQTISQPISKQQDITASFDGSSPIKAFTKTDTESRSDSAPVTGTGKTGTQSTGSVRALYLPASGSITIKAGSIMTCLNISECGGKALTFKTLEDHIATLLTSPFVINIQATDIGNNYNLPAGTSFSINSISPTDLRVTNVASFNGGESKEVQTVAQKDIDDLKSKLTQTIKDTALAKIVTDAGANTTILTDKVQINVTKVTTDHKVNEPTDILNMDMDATISFVGYDKSTVAPYVSTLLKQEQKDNLILDESTINITQNVKSSDSKSVVITLLIKAMLKPTVDISHIKSDLSGKSVNDVQKLIEKVPNIKFISYTYQPNWAPGFLKHIPSSTQNIYLDVKDNGK